MYFDLRIIKCLALIGVFSIVSAIAQNAYSSGRQDKEREIKKELKRQMKEAKKRGS